MISRFFSKSKPIHTIIVLLLMALVFIGAKFQYLSSGLKVLEISQQVFFLGLTLFTVFLIEFIVNKNSLSKRNAYVILIFALLVAILPDSIRNSKILVSNIFILFALRRLITLQSNIEVKKKLFDATLWVVLASLLNFWSILFLVLVVIAILFYVKNDSKNWLIPIVAIVTVAVLYLSYNIIVYNHWNLEKLSSIPFPNFDFSYYNNLRSIASITLIFSMFLWSGTFYFKKIREAIGKSKSAFNLIGLTAIIAFFVGAISPFKDGSEFLYLFAPLAIIMTNYLEQVNDLKFKEVLLWILVLAPVLNLVL